MRFPVSVASDVLAIPTPRPSPKASSATANDRTGSSSFASMVDDREPEKAEPAPARDEPQVKASTTATAKPNAAKSSSKGSGKTTDAAKDAAPDKSQSETESTDAPAGEFIATVQDVRVTATPATNPETTPDTETPVENEAPVDTVEVDAAAVLAALTGSDEGKGPTAPVATKTEDTKDPDAPKATDGKTETDTDTKVAVDATATTTAEAVAVAVVPVVAPDDAVVPGQDTPKPVATNVSKPKSDISLEKIADGAEGEPSDATSSPEVPTIPTGDGKPKPDARAAVAVAHAAKTDAPKDPTLKHDAPKADAPVTDPTQPEATPDAKAQPQQTPARHADRFDPAPSNRRDPAPASDAVLTAAKPADSTQPILLAANGPAPTTAVQQTTAAAAPNTSPVAVPIEGVAVEIASKALAGKNRFEIRLDPPELGRIHVRLDIDRNGDITSRLVADRPDTLDLLRRDASTLERALNDAGLRTADNGLQFSLRDHAFNQQNQAVTPQDNARLIVTDDALVSDAAQRGYYRPAGSGSGIDIRV
jgi:flagellar hook-length control protein FliK